MSEILEIIMIVSFGASWPLNVMKSYKARTTKGKSLAFLLLIFFGYIAGIASKFLNEAYMASFSEKWYVLFFYFLNLTMVGVDLILYFRNKPGPRLCRAINRHYYGQRIFLFLKVYPIFEAKD